MNITEAFDLWMAGKISTEEFRRIVNEMHKNASTQHESHPKPKETPHPHPAPHPPIVHPSILPIIPHPPHPPQIALNHPPPQKHESHPKPKGNSNTKQESAVKAFDEWMAGKISTEEFKKKLSADAFDKWMEGKITTEELKEKLSPIINNRKVQQNKAQNNVNNKINELMHQYGISKKTAEMIVKHHKVLVLTSLGPQYQDADYVLQELKKGQIGKSSIATELSPEEVAKRINVPTYVAEKLMNYEPVPVTKDFVNIEYENPESLAWDLVYSGTERRVHFLARVRENGQIKYEIPSKVAQKLESGQIKKQDILDFGLVKDWVDVLNEVHKNDIKVVENGKVEYWRPDAVVEALQNGSLKQSSVIDKEKVNKYIKDHRYDNIRVAVKRNGHIEFWKPDIVEYALNKGHLKQTDILGYTPATIKIGEHHMETVDAFVKDMLKKTAKKQTKQNTNQSKIENNKSKTGSGNNKQANEILDRVTAIAHGRLHEVREYKNTDQLRKQIAKEYQRLLEQGYSDQEALQILEKEYGVKISAKNVELTDLATNLKVEENKNETDQVTKQLEDIHATIKEKAVDLMQKVDSESNKLNRFIYGLELSGLGFASGIVNTVKGLYNLGKEITKNPVEGGVMAVTGFVDWVKSVPERIYYGFTDNPFYTGEVAGEILTGEVVGEGMGRVAGKVGSKALKVLDKTIPEAVTVKVNNVVNALKSKIIEVAPKRQTIVKGARIYEYETKTPLHTDILARIDRGATKQLDIANTEAVSGLRQVELITGKRWKIGKSETPTETAGKAKTLAEVTEYIKEKSPEGIKIIKRKGLGKAILDYESAESTVIRKISERGAIDVHTFEKLPTSLNEFSSVLQRISEVGKVPNVEAELLVTPSEFFRNFPKKLIKQEKVIDLNPIEKIVGKDIMKDIIKEVVGPSEKDLAIQRLMSKEYRRELAKTLRDIYKGTSTKKTKAVEVKAFRELNDEGLFDSVLYDTLLSEFKNEGVKSITQKTLNKVKEVAKNGEEKSVLKENNGDIVSVVEPTRRMRVTEVRFLPELTREILGESKKIEKFKGKVVKPEELIEKEKVIEKRLVDKILGRDEIKEVVEPSEKDLAIEKMKSKEYRRELAKTLRDIYGSKEAKTGAKAIEVLDEVPERASKAEEKAITDYPVLDEENIFDIVKGKVEKFGEFFDILKSGSKLLARTGIAGVGYKVKGNKSTGGLTVYPDTITFTIVNNKPEQKAKINEFVENAPNMFNNINNMGDVNNEINKGIEEINKILNYIHTTIEIPFTEIPFTHTTTVYYPKEKTREKDRQKGNNILPREKPKTPHGDIPWIAPKDFIIPREKTKEKPKVDIKPKEGGTEDIYYKSTPIVSDEELTGTIEDIYNAIITSVKEDTILDFNYAPHIKTIVAKPKPKPPHLPNLNNVYDLLVFGTVDIQKGVKTNPVAEDPFKVNIAVANKVFNNMFKKIL